MMSAETDNMKQASHMVTQAFLWNFAYPAILGIIAIGTLALAFEVVKRMIRVALKKRKCHRRTRSY
jgi:hypothetical protein